MTASLSYQAEFSTISYDQARQIVEIYHYSHTMPAGKNICFGWWIDLTLYAVAVYGIGVNRNQAVFLSTSTEYAVTNKNLIELKRLCRIEPKNDRLQLTQFLALCHRELRKLEYRYVISYSDPEHSHYGGIYKAANFTNLGQTKPENYLVDKHGKLIHRRRVSHYSSFHHLSDSVSRNELELTVHKSLPKTRWFLLI